MLPCIEVLGAFEHPLSIYPVSETVIHSSWMLRVGWSLSIAKRCSPLVAGLHVRCHFGASIPLNHVFTSVAPAQHSYNSLECPIKHLSMLWCPKRIVGEVKGDDINLLIICCQNLIEVLLSSVLQIRMGSHPSPIFFNTSNDLRCNLTRRHSPRRPPLHLDFQRLAEPFWSTPFTLHDLGLRARNDNSRYSYTVSCCFLTGRIAAPNACTAAFAEV
jgi:hypothetical protein